MVSPPTINTPLIQCLARAFTSQELDLQLLLHLQDAANPQHLARHYGELGARQYCNRYIQYTFSPFRRINYHFIAYQYLRWRNNIVVPVGGHILVARAGKDVNPGRIIIQYGTGSRYHSAQFIITSFGKRNGNGFIRLKLLARNGNNAYFKFFSTLLLSFSLHLAPINIMGRI